MLAASYVQCSQAIWREMILNSISYSHSLANTALVAMSNYSEKTDLELVDLCRIHGDHKAFACIVKRYERSIYNFILRMISSPAEAEELFQETFLRIYNNLENFKGGSSFSPWAYRIAHNLCIDVLRRPEKRVFVELDGQKSDDLSIIDRHEDTQSPNPEKELYNYQIGQSIQKAVSQLPPKLRAVFVMYQYDNLAYEQIASILEIPLGTVKSRMNAALKQLSHKLRHLITTDANKIR
jgi:RNA polymerase sigma-70 factor (ECF subfamily)